MFKLRWKILPILVTLFVFNSTYAQGVKIDLSVKNESLKQFIKQIEAKTDYTFMLDQTIDQSQTVTVDVRQESLDAILRKAFAGKKVSYEIVGKHIILKLASANQKSGIRKITGVVKDQHGDPIVGANIVQKGTTNGVISDLNGTFSINVPDNVTLQISYIGYLSKEVRIGNNTSLNIELKEDTQRLDEVVVVGYTTQKKGLLTGSVVTMKMNESLEKMATTSPADLLAGQMAGVRVGTAEGVPGKNPDISIRTKSSLNDQPILYVIDGIIRTSTDFNNLSPNEIEDITVLKDAASAAIYGARSEGGVILVTTKRGQIGKPKFNYSYSYGIDTRTANMDLTDAVQTAEIYNRVYAKQTNAFWRWSEEEIDYIRGINGGWGYDHLDAVWQNPSRQAHNVSMTGGTERAKYFAGVSYVRQESFLKSATYDKFNFRLNTTVDVTDKLQFFASMSLTDNKQSNGAESYSALLRWQPDQPLLTDGGQYMKYDYFINTAAEVNGDGGYDKSRNIRPQMSLTATYKLPIDGLSVKATYASSWKHDRGYKYVTRYDMYLTKRNGEYGHIISTADSDISGVVKSDRVSKDYLEKTSYWDNDYQVNFQLNYNRTFNQKHNVSAALVYERSELTTGDVKGGRESFPIYVYDQFWAASDRREDTWGGGGTEETTGRASFIGQFNYDYANKYLVNFSFREDGSMKFHKDKRWGFFPAASVGWIMSEEPFFDNLKDKVDFLKLRFSTGWTGNDNVGGWSWEEVYKGGNSTYFGKDPIKGVGIKYGDIANTALTWEKSFSYNIATDLHFLDHWNATLEYWFRNTYDILGTRRASVPTSFSLAMPKENYAEVHAKGFDFNLGYQNKWRNFGFRSQLTMSYGWNKTIVEDYAENAKWIDIPVGKSRDNIKGYKFDQIIRTQEQLDKFNEEHPGYRIGGSAPALGMMVYKDLSGPDGTPDGIIDSWDKVLLEKVNSPINYGISFGGEWKGINLDMMFNGQLAYKKSFKGICDGVEWNRMYTGWYDNSWTPENPNALLPKRSDTDKTYNEDSDFWLTDASYIRLKYINLGYTIPQNLYRGVFDRVKLFFSANNMFVLSHFKYWDPERGGGLDYPTMRSFNFGIDVTF